MISKRPFSSTQTTLLFAFLLLLALPYLFVIVGDAQVHLAVAENFANGRPFQYNPNGETVVASTSPFWTLLLTLFYLVVGNATPLLLKLVVLVLWLATAVLLYRTARDRWQFNHNMQLVVVVLWVGHTTVVSNALGGLENILSAFQLLWMYYLVTEPLSQSNSRWVRSLGLGLLIGWAILTRPDGGLFVLALFGLATLFDLAQANNFRRWLKQTLPRLFVSGIIAFLCIAPWYLYQYSVTGQLVTDSSVARLYNGRLGALMLIPDQLYFHPKALISLASAFLPLSFGVLVYGWQLWQHRSFWQENFVGISAVFTTLIGFIFYTFIVGAEAFGRYFLPLYPFLFLAGAAGLQQIYQALVKQNPQIARLFLILTALFIIGTSFLDSYRRLVPGQFSVNNTLDIIYGPAHQQYVSFNLFDLVTAPPTRANYTENLVQAVDTAPPFRIAVTEVQLRYFLDANIEVLSLDGRTSATILDYTDPTTGIPNFDRYLQDTQPHLVHINQWCAVGGFLASVFPTNISDNLICHWQKTAENLNIGDTFTWQGRTLTLVAPEIIKIDWDN